jgi:hypothetical protein
MESSGKRLASNCFWHGIAGDSNNSRFLSQCELRDWQPSEACRTFLPPLTLGTIGFVPERRVTPLSAAFSGTFPDLLAAQSVAFNRGLDNVLSQKNICGFQQIGRGSKVNQPTFGGLFQHAQSAFHRDTVLNGYVAAQCFVHQHKIRFDFQRE